MCYLRGPVRSGRSHLLQAVCHAALENGMSASYLPLAELSGYPAAEVLGGLEQQQLLCLDDLDCVAGKGEWETALFQVFNQRQHGGGRLCLSATAGPRELNMALPDLVSRLNMMLVCSLQPLADEDKQAALQLRARGRGIKLPDDVARFILHHLARDMCSLMSFLDRLDRLSLAEKRRITIPYVSSLLAGDGAADAERSHGR